jgi:hypothetical protein
MRIFHNIFYPVLQPNTYKMMTPRTDVCFGHFFTQTNLNALIKTVLLFDHEIIVGNRSKYISGANPTTAIYNSSAVKRCKTP